MSEHFWWYLSRSTGIVGLVLLILSFAWGIFLSTRALKGVYRPAWLLGTHSWLAGTALVMTALHVISLMLDSWVRFTLSDILIPGSATWEGATRTAEIGTAIGVLSLYLVVLIQVTSYLRRRMPRSVWIGIHRLSFPVVFALLVHAGWTGTDTSNRVYQVGAVMLAMTTAAATIIRIIIPTRGRRSAQPS